MLNKVLKYDLKFIFKGSTVVYYIVAAAAAALAWGFPKLGEAPFFGMMGLIAQNVALSMAIAMMVNGAMRAWVNFSQKMYGDPAYLTHTLPVPRETVYAAKVIAGTAGMLANLVAAVATIVVAYRFIDDLSVLPEKMAPVVGTSGVAQWAGLLMVGLVAFAEVMVILTVGYTALIAGNNTGAKRSFVAVLTGLAGYGLVQGLVVLALWIAAQFDANVMVLFEGGVLTDLMTPVYITLLVNVLGVAGFVAADLVILRKGVNVG